MNDFYCKAGLRIRNLRERKHMTREELAERADISVKFLYEIEVGQKGFSADTLARLTKALATNCDFVLYGTQGYDYDGELHQILHLFNGSQLPVLKKLLEQIHELCYTK